MTKVSVIMPAYNAEIFISESIESVIKQTFIDWELIIIDDGSTDKTAEVVSNYVNLDNRIKLYYQDNAGQGKARNHGIAKSEGKFIAFLDADDLMLPHKLDTQLRDIELYKVDLVFSDAYIFEKLPINGNEYSFNVKDLFYNGLSGLQTFLIMNRIPMLTVLVKKECILSVGGFSESKDIQKAEDYHLWLKLLLADFIFFGSNKVLSAYRQHSLSVSDSDRFNDYEVLFVLNDLIKNHQQIPYIFLNNFAKRKEIYLNRMINKDWYSFIVESQRYLKLFKNTKWRFRVLYYIEKFSSRRFSLLYLKLTTI
jgi:teichuronic acid biosynthesis glycosyltransferase TuaG